MKKEEVEEEQRKLVLARFKTLNPESKILLGGDKEITVKEVIKHIEKGNDFGKKVVKIQMKMIQVLSTGV